MLDVTDLETEAEQLAAQLRGARCCDALVPCYRCSLLKLNVLARRRVVEVPRPSASAAPTGPGAPHAASLALVVRACALDLCAC
jgi:hypothetical protein